MHKLISQPAPTFVQAIKNGLEYWLSRTKDLDAGTIKELDPEKTNLFHIVDYGLRLPELWNSTAELMVQVFPLPDRNGDWNLWLEKLNVVIDNSPKPATPTLVRLHINYGKLMRSLSEVEAALKAHHTAMHEAQNLKDDTLLANVFMEIGWDYLWKNDLDNAQLFGKKALQIYEEYHNPSNIYLVDTLRLLGSVEINRGNVDQGIHFFKKALWGAKGNKKPIVLARTYMSLGQAYQKKSNILEAMDCFGKASEVLLKTTYEDDKVNVFLNIGTLYFDQEEWAAAEAAFKMVNSRYLRETGKLITQAKLWNNLGNVYWKQGKLENAEKYLQDALGIWPKIGDEIDWANTLATMAEVYVLQARFIDAKQLINEAMEKVKKYPLHKWANEIKDELVSLEKRIEGKLLD